MHRDGLVQFFSENFKGSASAPDHKGAIEGVKNIFSQISKCAHVWSKTSDVYRITRLLVHKPICFAYSSSFLKSLTFGFIHSDL